MHQGLVVCASTDVPLLSCAVNAYYASSVMKCQPAAGMGNSAILNNLKSNALTGTTIIHVHVMISRSASSPFYCIWRESICTRQHT